MAGIPRLPTSYVRRPRLDRRLARLSPLTVVDALPGFGATTLVAGWARQELAAGREVAWFRATPGLTAADVLGRIPARGGRTTTIAVIDAAHLLDDCVVHDLVCAVASSDALHLVVRCEGPHEFHEAAARHGMETNVVRGSDLAVRRDEVGAFAAAWGHEVDDEDVDRLYAAVGGWLQPLRLVLDATPSWADSLATHAAEDFVLGEVLPLVLPDEEVPVVLRLAVAEELDPALALELAGPFPAGAPLASLERRGLLWRVPRADGAARWRFPTLMRRTLCLELARRDPAAAAEAHRTVARSLLVRDDPGQLAKVVEHARAAGDHDLLLEVWREHGWTLLGSDLRAFRVGYAGLETPGRGPLAVPVALAHALTVMPDETDWVVRVETLMRHYSHLGARFVADGAPPTTPSDPPDLAVAGMVALRNDGRFRDAACSAEALEESLARPRPPGERVAASQASWARFQSATTHLMAGHHGRAHSAARACYEASPRSLVGAGGAALVAALHAGSGDRAEAERWLATHETVDLGGRWAERLARLPARVARGMLAMDRLDGAGAEEAVADTSLTSDLNGMWPLVLMAHVRHALLFGEPVAMLAQVDHLAQVHARLLADARGLARQLFDRCLADLLLALTEVDRARALLDRAGALSPWLFAPTARFHLITSDPHQAERVARVGAWHERVHARDRLELHLISALSLRSRGETCGAVEDFRRAHALLQHTGNLEPYLLLPPEVLEELLHASGLELDAASRARLAGRGRIYPETADVIRLTPRELVVLREMGRHETAAAVAKSLSVSVNTVKKQMVSLYGKLGVHDRPAALMRARRLGLLDTTPPDAG